MFSRQLTFFQRHVSNPFFTISEKDCTTVLTVSLLQCCLQCTYSESTGFFKRITRGNGIQKDRKNGSRTLIVPRNAGSAHRF